MKKQMRSVVRSMFVALVVAGVSVVNVAAAELEPGAKAPGFSLVDAVSGKTVKYDPAAGKLSVVVFTCNQCPFAKAFEARLVEIGKEYAAKGVKFYAVNPNDDVAYPEETLPEMKKRAESRGFPFPYLKDGDSAIAKAYGARVTPHVYLVDGKGVVRYRGYVDDSAKPEEREHAGLTSALDALLAGQEIQQTATKAFGCKIKWKA